MKEYFDTQVKPLNDRLGEMLHVKVIDLSQPQAVFVRSYCNHEVRCGECVKCRIVIEEDAEDD